MCDFPILAQLGKADGEVYRDTTRGVRKELDRNRNLDDDEMK